MVAIAKLVDGLVISEEYAIGPKHNKIVSGNSSSTITLTISSSSVRVLHVLGVKSIELPNGLVIEGISAKDNCTIDIKVRNTTDSDITIDANSISATVVVVGY